MICVVTHRRLKPGAWDDFRKAWMPDDWWPGLVRAYHLRSVDDENEVISLGFYDGTADEFDAMRETDAFMSGESRRLERISHFEVETRIGGVYEVTDDMVPSQVARVDT